MKPHILVIGSYNQDLVWETPAFPLPGQTRIGNFVTMPGGKGSNQAVAAARLGASTAFCASVGDDTFGRALPEFYRAEGVEAYLAFKDRPTGNAAIWVNAEGENEIVISAGANGVLHPADIPLHVLGQAHLLVCQNECRPQTIAWAFEQARANGVKTLLNPAPMRDDFPFGILHHTDILVPNQTEFADLLVRLGVAPTPNFSASDVANLMPEAMHGLCRRIGVPTVVITLGRRGCFVDREGGFEHVLACEGVTAVDTTGAGDAFIGGFSVRLVQGHGDVIEAARYASAVAALSVTKKGATPSMPTRAEVEAFLGAAPC